MATRTLRFPSARHLHQLYAGREDNLSFAEKHLGVSLVSRDDWLQIDGPDDAIAQMESLIGFLNEARTQGVQIRSTDFTRFVEMIARGESDHLRELFGKTPLDVATSSGSQASPSRNRSPRWHDRAAAALGDRCFKPHR